jgi:ATP-dependent helicase/nuclease subunit A
MSQLTPQQKEALNFKSHISLTANAGSGKTFVLSKRFVEIYLNEDIDLSGIVAITFTDKAAGELNRKIANEIDERLQTVADITIKRRLEIFRRQLVSSNISTIHSFCINILREFAPEAEIDASFSPIDQIASEELIDLSIEETFNNLINDKEHSESLKYLIRFFGSKKILSSQLANSIQNRKTIEQLGHSIYNQNENDLAKYFRETFEKDFDSFVSKMILDELKNIKLINEFVRKLKAGNETASGIAGLLVKYEKQKAAVEKLHVLQAIKELMLTQKGEVRNRGYFASKRDELEPEINAVENMFAKLNMFLGIEEPDKCELELARFGKKYLEVFNYTNNLYAQKKKQKSFLDFEDILLYTQKIMELEDVKDYLRQKFKYIMIDEYQDTNELQYEIFMPILDNLKSGNLFIVGDEKQSIYMFRNAELEVFERTKNDIGSMKDNGKLLSLPHSFRMAPQLVLFTNILFSNLFKNADHHFNEVEPNNLVCAKSENEKGNVELLLANEEKEITESELVANKIIYLNSLADDEHIEFKDIAVLCRKRDSFSELEEAFVKFGIPYSIVGGKGFYQRQTIYDMYNYLSFLLNTEDDAALIGILRSPFFNISDLDLYEISVEDGTTYFEKLKRKALSGEQYKKVFESLNENIKIASSGEIYSLIRKILLESGYWSVLASKKNASQELANIEKLLRIAREFTKKSFKNLYDFTVSLRESIEGYEDEGQAQVAGDANTVKLMTIHQAKGLEYKAVFIYGCNAKAQEDSVRSKSLSIDKKYGLLTKVPIDENYFSKYSAAPITLLYNYSIHRKNIAELKRLLYVAVTRAVNHLFITATHKNYDAKPNSFFELIKEGLGGDLSTGELRLYSDVEFMKMKGEEYEFNKQPLSLKIHVQETITNEAVPLQETSSVNPNYEILTQKISDVPKSEIISATKISMFAQCPVKYQLTYQLGYSTIFNLMKARESGFEFNLLEDEELKQYGQLRGRIIHSVLKDKILIDFLSAYVEKKISVENLGQPETVSRKLIESIVDDVKGFYSSNTYKEITAAKNSRNEIEIYCEESGHYLYGIIDKLIIEEDKLIIVDYKTDHIKPEQLAGRAADYQAQLKFYAYILSKLYKNYSKFELRLLFLKHPEQPFITELNRVDLSVFREEINKAVKKIYLSEFIPNLNHCSKCHFALEGNKCVKPF